MNQWMTKKFEVPATPIDRGKVVRKKTYQNA